MTMSAIGLISHSSDIHLFLISGLQFILLIFPVCFFSVQSYFDSEEEELEGSTLCSLLRFNFEEEEGSTLLF